MMKNGNFQEEEERDCQIVISTRAIPTEQAARTYVCSHNMKIQATRSLPNVDLFKCYLSREIFGQPRRERARREYSGTLANIIV